MNRTRFLNLILLTLIIPLLIGCREGGYTAVTSDRPGLEPVARPTATTTAVPTAVNLPAVLEASTNTAISLDEFPPDLPLVVHFNQPMHTNGSYPLLFSPPVKGTFTWDDTTTTLTFTPETSFIPDRNYTVTASNWLRSVSGVTFAQVQRWRLHTQSTPEVSHRTPAGAMITDGQPLIHLRFNHAMDAASVADALSITPPLAYTLTWENDTSALLAIQEPLTFAATYAFTLAKTAVDMDGLHLAQPYQWSYTLKPSLQKIDTPTATNHLAPISLHFNYPIDPDSLTHSLRIEPAIDGKLTWNETHTIATYTPTEQLPASTIYTIRFQTALYSPDGIEMPTPELTEFTTPAPVLAATPAGSNTDPANSIAITFDRSMDAVSTEAAFRIMPAVPGDFTWAGTTLTFRPETGYFAENETYIITLSTTALSHDGTPVLPQPHTWSFHTRELVNLTDLGYGPHIQILDANGRRALQMRVFTQDSIRLKFELYSLTENQFLDHFTSGYQERASWNGQEGFPTENTLLQKSWQMETAVSEQEWCHMQEIIVPTDVPPGLYILNLIAGNLNDQLLLVITANTLTVKLDNEQILAWVTNINGQIVPDIPVAVYTHDGFLLANGRTDDKGFFRTQLPAHATRDTSNPERLVIFAQNGTYTTIVGLDPEWQNSWGQYRNHKTQPYAAYIITDRPIYRPGQTVYFKATLRQDEDALLSLPSTGMTVTARIRDANEQVVQTTTMTTNDFGSVDGSFTLAAGAISGLYYVEIDTGTTTHQQAFKVEAYKQSDYAVVVSANTKHTVQGTPITITVDTLSLLGVPIANAQVTIRRFYLDENFNGGPETYVWYDANANIITGQTDENGRFTTTVHTDQISEFRFNREEKQNSLSHATLGIEAAVDNGNHQTVSDFTIVQVYDTDTYLMLDLDGYVQSPGQPFTVQAQVNTIFGEPVANSNLTLSLRRWDSESFTYATIVDSITMTTDENGHAHLTNTIADPGYYQLNLSGKDSGDRPIYYIGWVYAIDNFSSFWHGHHNNTLSVTPDKTSYAPGDTAHLIVESTVSGPALLVVERGTIRREQLVNLTTPVTIVDLPIEPDDTPNIHVSLNVWQEQDTTLNGYAYTSMSDSRLTTAYALLNVPATDKQLTVTITPDQEVYAPRDEATFTVRVTNWKGEPISAEVSLALVDETIFALSEEMSDPIYDAFYFLRASMVNTFNSLSPIRYLDGGGCGGGYEDNGSRADPRYDFLDTAAWFPILRTDFNGETTVTVTLPDNLTYWRVTAKAVTADTQVGQVTTIITTR